MAMKTFTLTRGGVTSTLGLNRDIEAGVKTFESGYLYPADPISETSQSHFTITKTDDRNFRVVSDLANDGVGTFKYLIIKTKGTGLRVGDNRLTFDITLNGSTVASDISGLMLRLSKFDTFSFHQPTVGSNTFDLEITDDGVEEDPRIYFAFNANSVYDISISNLKVTYNYKATTVDRTASVIDSDRKGESRPLLSKVVGAAAAAYSLRDLNDKQGNNAVVTVRRNSDDITREFLAKEVTNGTLEDWVKAGATVPPRQGSNKVSASGGTNYLSILWDSDNKGLTIKKTDFNLSNNETIRLFHQTQAGNTFNSGNFRVSFNLTRISGDPLTLSQNTGNLNNQDYPKGKPLFLSYRDDDSVDDNPDYLNKGYEALVEGFNTFDLELFDDGDVSKPAISLILHKFAEGEYKISDIEILHEDSGIDGFVTKWHDQSGNGIDAEQTDTAAQPRIVTDGEVNSEGIKFDGVDDFLDIGGAGSNPLSIANQTPLSIYSVQQPSANSILGDNTNRLLEFSTNRGFIYLMQMQLSETWNTTVHPTNLSIFSFTHGGTGTTSLVKVRVNGSDATTSSAHQNTSGANTASSAIEYIGKNQGGNTQERFEKHLKEIIIYKADQGRNTPAIEANIANQYAITLL